MNEKLLEKKLRLSVEEIGGLAVKNTNPYFAGLPDRTIYLPYGKAAFAEVKTTGKRPTPLQTVCLERFRKMGFIAEVIDSQKSLDEFIEKIKQL